MYVCNLLSLTLTDSWKLGSYSDRGTDTVDVILWTAKGQVRKPYLRRILSSSAAVGGQFGEQQAAAGRTFNTVSETRTSPPHTSCLAYHVEEWDPRQFRDIPHVLATGLSPKRHKISVQLLVTIQRLARNIIDHPRSGVVYNSDPVCLSIRR